MSDVIGVSRQARLRAMVRGEADPENLARLARKRLRGKIPALQEAVAGTLNEHPRLLLDQWLTHCCELQRSAKFDQRFEEQMHPFCSGGRVLDQPSGNGSDQAWTIVAEIGPHMSQ